MNLVRDEQTGEWVTQYGRAAIERPNIDARLPPPVIPRKYLPQLARLQAVEDRAGLHKRKRSLVARFGGYLCLLATLAVATALTFWIPAFSPGHVNYNTSPNNNILSLPWLQNYAHDLSRCWGALVLWVTLVVTGHSYVAVFSCGRNNPFKSFDGRYREFVFLFLLGLLLFCVGPVFTLASMHIPNTASTHWVEKLFSFIDTNGAKMDDTHENDLHAMYHDHVGWRFFFAFVHNTLFYVLPFSAALHFTYVEEIPKFWAFQRKLGNPSLWRSCGVCDVGFLLALCMVAIGLLAFHCWLLYVERLLLIYTIVYAGIGVVVLGTSALGCYWLILRWRFWAALAVLFPLTRFFNPVTGIAQAILAGVLVERATSLGFQWIWQSRKYHFYRRLYRVWLLGVESAGPKDADVIAYLPLTDVQDEEMFKSTTSGEGSGVYLT